MKLISSTGGQCFQKRTLWLLMNNELMSCFPAGPQEPKVVFSKNVFILCPLSSPTLSSFGYEPISVQQEQQHLQCLRNPESHHTAVQHLFWKSCSTTVESASVEMSPRSRSPQAILRNMRLMILPVGGVRGV